MAVRRPIAVAILAAAALGAGAVAWAQSQKPARKLRSLLVVTSAYHSRRALWTLSRVFAGTGIEIGLQSVETGEQTPAPATWWLHLRGWQMVGGEYVKNVYYRIFR